ncbi:DUF2312 domain-containing protein [Sphingomonas nostoxanthinifaciens]|uniref:DUF2312 domain-containing protein n=1 Tax=Sphingomonas nostoxanthinifaciens TaxID=2872652 RepID=UPI002953B069|nr:GapR family DNA-binding domain-containing protein [Sphingomonas nostoxanthinifaciens]
MLPKADTAHSRRIATDWQPPEPPMRFAAAEPDEARATRPVEDIAAELVGAIGLDGARRLVRVAATASGMMLPPAVPDPAVDWLTKIVERVEQLFAERAQLAEEIRNAFTFAKDCGFDARAIRACVADRAMDKDTRFEREAIRTVYRAALGIEDPDFAIELPAPAVPAPPKARKLTAREKNYRQALALTAASAAIIDQ